MIVPLSPATAAHAAIALRSHIRRLRRDGITPPPAVVELAEALLSGRERTELVCWCAGRHHEKREADPPGLLSAGEAAHLLRISARSLRRCAASGDIAQIRIGRRVLYDPAGLAAYVAARTTRRTAVEPVGTAGAARIP